MIILRLNFEKNIKSMSVRKYFCKYYHAIISHASDHYKIINGHSSNTESDERYFHTIKDISNNTSNHHPDNIISNAFIHCQVQPRQSAIADMIADIHSYCVCKKIVEAFFLALLEGKVYRYRSSTI